MRVFTQSRRVGGFKRSKCGPDPRGAGHLESMPQLNNSRAVIIQGPRSNFEIRGEPVVTQYWGGGGGGHKTLFLTNSL